MKDKIEQLLMFHKETPNDPFLVYALANTYHKQKEYEKAVVYYELLLQKHPNYEGTYLHYAQLNVLLNKFDKANEIYNKGITILTQLNDTKNLNELKEAYETFKQTIN